MRQKNVTRFESISNTRYHSFGGRADVSLTVFGTIELVDVTLNWGLDE